MTPSYILTVPNQESLAFKGRNDAPQIVVEGEGIYQWEASARGVNIAASGGGYWVRLFTGGGSSTPSLSTPASFLVTGKTNTSIALDWSDVANATTYLLERSATGTSGWAQIYSGSISSYTDTGLTPSTTYYYRVKAIAAGYLDSAYATLNDTTSSGSVVTLTEAILVLKYGQSNDVGRGDPDSLNEVVVPSGVYEFVPSTTSVKQLADPTGMTGDYSQATSRSMNPNLGKRLLELTGKPVIMVAAGKGNTAIDTFINTTGSEYTTALSRWNSMVSYCTANGITVLNKVCVYTQGENDAGTLEADAYLNKLNTLVDLLTTNFGIEQVFDVRIGYNPTFTADANSEKIMKGKSLLNLNKDPYMVATIAPASFTQANGKMKADGVHYTVTGLNQVGDEVAQAINRWRSLNKKAIITETVTNLQDPGGYFDDIYLFRSLKSGVNNTDYNELFNRNNLSLISGSPTFNGKFGLTVPGSTPLIPATIRDLANTHDWSIDMTFRMDNSATSGMLITGRSTGSWQEDWVWIDSSNSINIKGNGVAKAITPITGANFLQLSNLVLVYTYINNTLKVYYNGVLTNTITDWAFSTMRLEAIARGYTTTPTTNLFKGSLERVRIVKKALATYEFDKSPNMASVQARDWDFQLNGSLAEAQGDTSLSYVSYTTNNPITPTFDADGLVADTNGYGRFGEQLSISNDFTCEFRLKITDLTATRNILRGGSTPGNAGSDIAFFAGLSTPSSQYFQFMGKFWTLGSTFNPSIFHIYKIVQNKTANTLVFYVDGVQVGTTQTSLATFTVSTILGGNPQNTGMIGTLDYFKFKNSL